MRVVAEAGQTMMGDIDLAITQARLAAEAGAWGYKTQLLTPEKIAQPDAHLYWADKFGNRNQREAFTRAGLIDYGAWREVFDACNEFGITFLATPFDLDAVRALAKIGVKHYKIASGDLTYRHLIEACADTGAEVILSTGAAYLHEIDAAIRWCDLAPITLLACTLSYPTPPEAAHLSRIETLRARYSWLDVGYSDHTSLPDTGLAAAALGSTMNEVHYTLDRNGPDVPDHAMAVDPQVLARYVTASIRGELLRGSPTMQPCPEELAARQGARRSVCAARALPTGHVVTEHDFVFLRPGGRVPPCDAHELVGMVIHAPMTVGQPF